MLIKACGFLLENISLTPAWLIHRRAWRETSLIMDVFTRDYGLVSVLAKGALRGKRTQAGLLQPFLPFNVFWRGRTDLPVLNAVEPRGKAMQLSGRALYCGFYLNELLYYLLHRHDPHPGVFELYESTLATLQSDQRIEKLLRGFELSLLEQMGYGLELEHEADSYTPLESGRHYHFIVEHGARPAVRPDAQTYSGSTLLALAAGAVSGADQQAEAKRLMRQIINHYLAGRTLKSRDLFKYAYGKPGS
ncbi:DNA repair protein RecO [Candidatus Methylospira mobilis]|nr:DNA repair protein RecO [Candidatus Methylospira mobilis]WNV04055.1 DNA repair protein RecO [Candidatus Methylospira mobilis]